MNKPMNKPMNISTPIILLFAFLLTVLTFVQFAQIEPGWKKLTAIAFILAMIAVDTAVDFLPGFRLISLTGSSVEADLLRFIPLSRSYHQRARRNKS